MDTALVTAPPMALEPASTPLTRLMAMPAASKLKLGAGVAMVVAMVVALSLWGSQGDMRVLFSGLSDKDAGAVLQQLDQQKVAYKITDGGSIMVPAEKMYELKLKLAQAGLPKASVLGNEIFDANHFGQTQTQERMNLQRAKEGELTRTIQALDAVESARVHLALPNQNGFFREQEKASASVVLMLRGGRTLDRAQIAGIVHLVASSIPDLDPKSVSVLDQTGTLLTQSDDKAAQGLDPTQLQYVSQVEQGYTKRIQELLEPVVGHENLRASVAADIDFSQSEATSEQFKPNQGNEPAAVRSAQVSDSSQGGAAAPSGIPGAASNQPPVPATAPINGASAPLQPAQNGGGAGANGSHRESTTNYEVDRTVRVVRNGTGMVRRLNAAVIVNHKVSTDAKGKVTSTPLPQEELDKLTALVQEAIGYNKERGDSVKVINAPFRAEPPSKPDDVPFWKQPWLLDLLRAGAVPAALALVGLAVVFGLVKPAVMAAMAKPPVADDAKGQQLDAVVDDEPEQLPGGAAFLEPPMHLHKLEHARQLAKDNPTAVANIVRDWVNGDTSL